MTTATTRKTRQATNTTAEPVPSGTLIKQAREHASGGLLDRLAEAQKTLTERTSVVGIVGEEGAVYAELGEALARGLEAGDPVPDDHRETITALVAERQARAAEARIVRHATQVLADRVNEVKIAASDGALRWLNTQLQDVMAQIHHATDGLNGISTPEQAINAGPAVVTAWQAARSLIDQLREIRAAQRVLTADARGGYAGVDRDLQWAGTCRTPFDAAYQVAVGHTKTWIIEGHQSRIVYEPEPWPGAITDSDAPSSVLPTTDPIGFVAWLADRGDSWIPRVTELADALKAREVAIALRTPIEELADTNDLRVPDLRHLDRLEQAGTR